MGHSFQGSGDTVLYNVDKVPGCYDYENKVFSFWGNCWFMCFTKLSVENLVFYQLTCESSL